MLNEASIVIMYAVTPCHAGSGSALGVVDLPIQRERHTNWPVIQATGVKGAFRSNFEKFKGVKQIDVTTESIFGTSDGGSSNGGWQGACSMSDAKILAYPMRSNVAPFVWITCPSVLKRFVRDLEAADRISGIDSTVFTMEERKAVSLGSETMSGSVLIEDFEVEVQSKDGIKTEFDKITAEFKKEESFFKVAERLLLVSDKAFNYGVTDCTQIMAQISIDQTTGTTVDGSLRYQEELPSDTIMYSVIYWDETKDEKNKKTAKDVRDSVINVVGSYIQIAGDETCGRGIFKLDWYNPEERKGESNGQK